MFLPSSNRQRKGHEDKRLGIARIQFLSFVLWQITSTAILNDSAKAMASQSEALMTKALIIIIRLNKATITVRAFFSVKYFFIFDHGLHGQRGRQIYNSVLILPLTFGELWNFFD
jgi:hypothetical protein